MFGRNFRDKRGARENDIAEAGAAREPANDFRRAQAKARIQAGSSVDERKSDYEREQIRV
jgi:hypothetical protein